MNDETEQGRSVDEISLRVDWQFPKDLQSKYANNVLVQAGQYEFVISFFEIQPPLLLGSPEENKAKLKEMDAIPAECVSRIIASPELVPGLIKALQTELEKFYSQRQPQ